MILRFVVLSLFVLLVLFFFAIPAPEKPGEINQGTLQLPWHIKSHADGSTEVFGLRLMHSTLADGIARFQDAEAIAIYQGEKATTLEAYFGTVRLGPLKAKLVLTLDLEADEIDGLLQRATGIAMSDSPDRKIELSAEDRREALNRRISGITFIPNYSGLEADFFRQRFGEPEAWLRHDENAIEYFYPDKGLSILIDAKGREVLQYSHTRAFNLPADTQTSDSLPTLLTD